MDSIADVFTYPTRREDWIKTVLIGGFLLVLSVVIIPVFIAYGYVVRTIQARLDGNAEPPAFEGWIDLLVDGFQAWVIGIIYLLVPTIIAVLTVGGAITSAATGGQPGAAVAGGALIGLFVSLLLAVAFGYLAVIGIVNFARHGRFSAAFDVATLKAVALDSNYAVAWLVSVLAFLLGGVVTAVPVIGWLLAPFVTFYVAIVAAGLWADGFTDAIGAVGATGRTGDDRSAI